MSELYLSQSPKDIKARGSLFKICKNKNELRKWIWFFLGVELPSCIVDPESNSSPLDMAWEIYSKALANDDPKFDRVLYYASRGGGKTLVSAIIEVLALFHLDRDVGHMAALIGQAQTAQNYVKDFLNRPILRDFKIGDNLERIDIIHYFNKQSGIHLTEKEWKRLSDVEKDNYTLIRRYVKIVVATVRACNGDHFSLLILDELEIIADKRAYEQSKGILDTIDGKSPITILTSTRKFATGLVQQEIDGAIDEDGEVKLHIRKWNAIDVTQQCAPERCLPELPKIPIYVNENTFKSISEKQYNDLIPSDQLGYTKNEGYQGCLSNCKLYSVCGTRLYTLQKSKAKMLKPIDQTINQLRKMSPEMVVAEILCRKPASTGMVYPNLDRAIHMKTAAQLAEILLGHSVNPNFTKKDLISLIKNRDDWHFYAGMDFGYTHNFAVVTGAADGYRCFILDVISEPNLLPDRQVAICNSRLKGLNPQIFADPENPMLVAVLRQAGFRMKKWTKGPGSLVGGIDSVRLKLREPLGEPSIFFFSGDPGAE